MTNERIALDHDSTLANIQPVAFDLLFGPDHEYKVEDVESWAWGIEEFGADRYLSALWHSWTLRPHDIEPCEEGLDETVAALREEFQVDIVTAHPDHQGISKGKEQWLDDHSIEYDNFEPVLDMGSKADLGYEIYIDDKPHLADEISVGQTMFLIDQPWNQEVEEGGNVVRVSSVAEATDALYDHNLW